MPQQSLTCILTMSRILSCCLSRYRGWASGRELEDDAVDRVKVVTGQRTAQSDQKLDLLLVERSAVGAVIIRNLDPSAVAAANSFNGVCTHERRHIIANRPFTNVELAGQVVIGIMPPEAKKPQQPQAPFGLAHVLTPFRLFSKKDDTL